MLTRIVAALALVISLGALGLELSRGLPAKGSLAPLKVTAMNELSPLPQPYNGRGCRLFVMGSIFSDRDLEPAFRVVPGSSRVLWDPTASGFALSPPMTVTSDC